MILMLEGIAAVVCLIAGLFMIGIGQNDFPLNQFLAIPGGCLFAVGIVLLYLWVKNGENSLFWIRCSHCGKQMRRTFEEPEYCPYCGNSFHEDATK